VAAVDGSGRLRAVGAGVATVSAIVEGTHSAIRMRVVTDEAASGAVSPADPAGQTQGTPRRRARIPRTRGRGVSPAFALGGVTLLALGFGVTWFWPTDAPTVAGATTEVTGAALEPLEERASALLIEASEPRSQPGPSSGGTPEVGSEPVAELNGAPTSSIAPVRAEVAARSDEEEVHDLVDRFVASLPSLDMSRVRGAYPELRGDEAWWRFVAEHADDSLRIAFFEMHDSYPHMMADGTAKVQFDLTFSYGAGQRQPWLLSASAVREGREWRLSDVRYHQ
jgi:hypothetical protein